MILTDHFVYIHQPKTGGTFVTQLLAQLYQSKINDTFLTPLPVNINKHGACSEIPESHQKKPILATVRNPYDKYVSQYKFSWWKKYPESFCEVSDILQKYPHFPEITFEEFLQLSNTLFIKLENSNFNSKQSLGRDTELFVKFFFENPYHVFPAIDEDYITAKKYQKDMFTIHFIRTDQLNQGLYDFLLSVGHNKKKLEFILASEKIFPPEGGRNQEEEEGSWEKFYTPELKKMVRKKERLIFTMFPEFDI